MNCVSINPLEQREPGVAERIHAVQLAAYAQEAALLQVKHFPVLQRTSVDVKSSKERFLGAFAGNDLVGAVSIETGPKSTQRCIASLVVAPSHQRQGIGRLLLAAALHECASSVVTVSTGAKNLPALALYAELGFVECARRSLGPETLELVTLRRSPAGQDT